MNNLLNQNTDTDIIVITNSPGELSAMARPAILAISQEIPHARIILVLTPCQYSSGKEIDYAQTIPGVRRIISPKEYLRWFFFNKKPAGMKFNRNGAVVFLGGDLLHAVVISKKLHLPAIAYVNDRIGWKKHFKKFVVPDAGVYQKFKKAGLKEEKLKIIGDLMTTSIIITQSRDSTLNENHLDPQKKIIAFMPGSRQFQINFMLPFFLQVIDQLAAESKDLQFVFSLSPFTEISSLQRAFKNPAQFICSEKLNFVVSEQGNQVLLAKSSNYEIINCADLCVTIPGTNTAQLAALGKPMIVVFPLNQTDEIPTEGLFNLITRLPLVGKYIKNIAALAINRMTKYFALPNIKAQKEIVPEIRGIIKPQDVTSKILELLSSPDQIRQMSTELQKTMGEKNAAQNLAREVKKLIDEATPTK